MSRNSAIVKKYADAVYKIATKEGHINEVNNSLNYLKSIFKSIPLINQVLITQQIKFQNKKIILENVFGNKISIIETELIFNLIEQGYFILFKQIVKRFSYLVSMNSDLIEINIISSNKYDSAEIIHISNKIEEKLRKKINVTIQIDPSLLGGIKLRADNTLYDSSVSNRIYKLKHAMLQE